MAMNLDIKRIVRRLDNGVRPSLGNVADPRVKRALRAVSLGHRPSTRSGNPELDKAIRQILNRR